jgi:hypothetical protein
MDKQQREASRARRAKKVDAKKAAKRQARDTAAAKLLAAQEAAQAEAEAAAKQQEAALNAKRAKRIAKVMAWNEKTAAVAADTAQRRAAKRVDTVADTPATPSPEEEAGLRNFIVRKLTGNARPWIHTMVDGQPVYTKAWADASAFPEPVVMAMVKTILADIDIAGITIESPESSQALRDMGLAMRVVVPESQFHAKALEGLTKHNIALSIHEDRAAFPLPVVPKKKADVVGFSLAEGRPKRLIRGEDGLAAGAFLADIKPEGFAQGIDTPPVKPWVAKVRQAKEETPLTEVEKLRDANVKQLLTTPPANYEMRGMSWRVKGNAASHRSADIDYGKKLAITDFEDFKASIKRVFEALGVRPNQISVGQVKDAEGAVTKGVAHVVIPNRAFEIIDAARKKSAKGGQNAR